MNKKLILLFFIFIGIHVSAQEIKVTSGKIVRFLNFKSQFVDARHVDVWLPNGYSDKEKYAVLYMHDGQMLFDAEQSWNKQAWEIDEVASKIIAENKTRKFIVVGIWNNGDYRHSEYFPEKIIARIPESTRKIVVEEQLNNKPQADNYLKFIVEELKPHIDKNFATKKDVNNTFMAGSSMGGLISLYAICEYPSIFGGAACLSTHTPMIKSEKLAIVADSDVASKFRDYLKIKLPNPTNHKIYFDYGDQTLDAYYKPFQEKIDLIMTEKGYTARNWITKFFPGKDHSENAWRERVHIPLEFFLRK